MFHGTRTAVGMLMSSVVGLGKAKHVRWKIFVIVGVILAIVGLMVFGTRFPGEVSVLSQVPLITSLIDATHEIPGGHHAYWTAPISEGVSLNGSLSVSNGTVSFLIMDKDAFNNYNLGYPFRYIYDMEDVSNISIKCTIPYNATWHFLIENFDSYSKTVKIVVREATTQPAIITVRTGSWAFSIGGLAVLVIGVVLITYGMRVQAINSWKPADLSGTTRQLGW